MTHPRDVLNRLRWESGEEAALVDVRIVYRHRGAPRDERSLEGRSILAVGRSFLDLPEGVRLPMHRILRIEKDGEVLWDRRRDARSSRTR